jgi:uncharacterized protein YjbI with pentapeptide repeats
MPDTPPAPPEDNGWYEAREFRGLDLAGGTLRDAVFERCVFIACRFDEATLHHCRFSDCLFEDCDLSRVKLPNCRFADTRLRRCNALGVDWTLLEETPARLPLTLVFEECALSFGSFYGLPLRRAQFGRCRVHEADFTEADLSHADLRGADFQGSTFVRTNLGHADLREATNFAIDPTSNTIRKARFSLPEAVTLLRVFDIRLD